MTTGPGTDQSVQVTLQRAYALLLAGRPQETLAELATLPAAAADNVTAFKLRGASLARLDRWDDVREAARGGLAAGGPDADLYRMLGTAERQRGDTAAAERALLEGLALEPSHVDLLCTLAQMRIDARKFKHATELVKRALAVEPAAPIVFATRVHLDHARGRNRSAQRISREFIAEHPDNAVAHALLGSVSAARGQVNQAYEGFRQAAAAEPTDDEFARAAMTTRMARHPLMFPLRPFMRVGRFKPWLVVVILIPVLGATGQPGLVGAVVALWFTLCLYSWIVPPILRWRLRRRWQRFHAAP